MAKRYSRLFVRGGKRIPDKRRGQRLVWVRSAKVGTPHSLVQSVAVRWSGGWRSVGRMRGRVFGDVPSFRVAMGRGRRSSGAKAIGFSHADFGFVVQAFDHAAGELLACPEI